MSKIINSGMLLGFVGIAFLIGLPKTLILLYCSSALLFGSSMLGLAYALWPHVKPIVPEIIGIVTLDFIALAALILGYYSNIDLMPTAIVAGITFFFPTLFSLCIVAYRQKH